MNKYFGNIVKKSYVYVIFFALLCHIPAFAQNMLSEIQINPEGDSYGILLTTEKPVPIKKVIESNSKIYIELQNVEPITSVSTVYNNVPNIKNVVVEPSTKGSVKIIVQGKNADKAKVGFESLKAVAVPSANTIELNPPIEAYDNIYGNDSESETVTIIPFKEVLVPGLKQAKNLIGSKMLYFLGFIMILAFGARLFRKNTSSKSQSSPIGLSRNLETDLPADETSTLSSLPRRKAAPKPDTAKTNYGLSSYQNSQRSPYATPYRMPLKKYSSPSMPSVPTVPSAPTELQSAPVADLQSKLMTATLNSHAASAPKDLKVTGKVDSKKFIESMTQIYEKNGRSDLAEGLRNSLKKMQSKRI